MTNGSVDTVSDKQSIGSGLISLGHTFSSKKRIPVSYAEAASQLLLLVVIH